MALIFIFLFFFKRCSSFWTCCRINYNSLYPAGPHYHSRSLVFVHNQHIAILVHTYGIVRSKFANILIILHMKDMIGICKSTIQFSCVCSVCIIVHFHQTSIEKQLSAVHLFQERKHERDSSPQRSETPETQAEDFKETQKASPCRREASVEKSDATTDEDTCTKVSCF